NIASTHFAPARDAWRGAVRAGSVRKPHARTRGASSASCAAIARSLLRVRICQLNASTSRQWPSERKSAASAEASSVPSASSKRASQWLAMAASVSGPACIDLQVTPLRCKIGSVKPDDLSRLKINRPADGAPRLRPRRRWARCGSVAAVLALAAAWAASRYAAPVPVEAATVANTYPTLAFTVLNAAGYVVPERKAALSSKASGRLEWLGVLEGSRVKQNEVVARLESK